MAPQSLLHRHTQSESPQKSAHTDLCAYWVILFYNKHTVFIAFLSNTTKRAEITRHKKLDYEEKDIVIPSIHIFIAIIGDIDMNIGSYT